MLFSKLLGWETYKNPNSNIKNFVNSSLGCLCFLFDDKESNQLIFVAIRRCKRITLLHFLCCEKGLEKYKNYITKPELFGILHHKHQTLNEFFQMLANKLKLFSRVTLKTARKSYYTSLANNCHSSKLFWSSASTFTHFYNM